MIRALGWDDWLILVALNSFVCQAAFLIHIALMERKHNLEMPLALSNALEVSDNRMRFVTCTDKVLQYVSLEFGFYLLTTFWLKLSLAVFFLRIVSSSALALLLALLIWVPGSGKVAAPSHHRQHCHLRRVHFQLLLCCCLPMW